MCLFVIYMISSAVWKELGLVNFSKDNQFEGREQLVVFEKIKCQFITNFTGKNSRGYFSIICMQKLDSFFLCRVYSSLLRPLAFASSPKSLGFPCKDLLRAVELFLRNN